MCLFVQNKCVRFRCISYRTDDRLQFKMYSLKYVTHGIDSLKYGVKSDTIMVSGDAPGCPQCVASFDKDWQCSLELCALI